MYVLYEDSHFICVFKPLSNLSVSVPMCLLLWWIYVHNSLTTSIFKVIWECFYLGSGVHQDIGKDGQEEPTNEDEDEDEDRGSVMVEQLNPSYIPLEVKIPSDDLKKEYVNV